jgi:hypothetical protein
MRPLEALAETCRANGRIENNEKLRIEIQDLERHTRPGSYRVRPDGWFRGRRRWRHHARRGDEHQHDFLEGRVGNEQRRHQRQLSLLALNV